MKPAIRRRDDNDVGRGGGSGTAKTGPETPWWHQWYRQGALSPRFDYLFVALLLAAEVGLGMLVIRKVAYTEIDWVAYMQEVEGYLDGERDYRKLRGDTGPLVYPAGFLYLYSALRRWTDRGTDIRTAQHIFLALYVLLQGAVLLLYQTRIRAIRNGEAGAVRMTEAARIRHVWSWRVAMGAMCLSKRIHSIFVLRLFNDGPTMLLFYASVLLFAQNRWFAGCVLYSLAVSVKMNVLLSAPGLLLLLLQSSPDLKTLLWRLGAGCALPQFLLGAPFLLEHPVSYLRKAFELDRVFFYQWTVNWKFLPEDLFTSKGLSILLLILHLSMLGVLARSALAAAKRKQRADNGGASRRVLLPPGLPPPALSPHYVIYTLFVSNFVGVCFARTLHYQFYAWYFHTLPYLLWTTIRESSARLVVRLLLLGGIEYAFLTFPATPASSTVLQACHLVVLASVWVHGFPSPTVEAAPAASPIRRPAATTPGSPAKKRV